MNYWVCLVQAMHTIFQARHILFQVRLSLIVIPDLIRRHPELDSGQNEYTLIQVRHSHITSSQT